MLHPAENRGYRELLLTARQGARRLDRLAAAFGEQQAGALRSAAVALERLITDFRPPLAALGLHTTPAAEGGGVRIADARTAVVDRFLERNQALRLAVGDVERVANLLPYLAAISERRGDTELPDLCASSERRLRRQAGAIRKSVVELASDPDAAIEPFDPSPAGRAAHGAANAFGTFGEWVDRKVSTRRR